MFHEELEISRTNITPAQFVSYVKRRIRDKKFTSIVPEDIDLDYWAKGGDYEFSYHDDPDKPEKAEKSISQPYDMQTYIRHWNDDVYNLIMQFNFWDDKRGSGYFYYVCKYGDVINHIHLW